MKNCDSYEKTKNGSRIFLHCVCISASIDKFIGFRKLKKKTLYLINKVVSTFNGRPLLLLIFFFFFLGGGGGGGGGNVLPAMMKRTKFNCSFISYLLLSIRHNI